MTGPGVFQLHSVSVAQRLSSSVLQYFSVSVLQCVDLPEQVAQTSVFEVCGFSLPNRRGPSRREGRTAGLKPGGLRYRLKY